MSTKDNQDEENSPTDLDKQLDHLSISKQQNKLNNDEELNLDNSSAKKNTKKFRILNGEQSASNENLNLNNLENNDNEQQQKIKSEQFIPPTLLANNLNDDDDEDNKNNENNEPDRPKKGRPGRKKGSKIKKLNLDETEDSSIRRRSSRLKVIEEKKDETPSNENSNNELINNLNDNDISNSLIDNQINEQTNDNMECNETIKQIKDDNQDEDQSSNKKKKTKDKKKTTKNKDDKRKLKRKSSLTVNKSESDENDNLDNRPNLNDSNQIVSPNELQQNNFTNQDLNDLKPEKVKSRWRRNSELESNNDNFINDSDNLLSNNNEISQSNDNLLLINNDEQNKAIPDIVENIEPMPEFSVIDYNIFLVEKKQTKFIKEVKKMVCDCILTKEERSKGIMGCGEDCLNRMLMIECGSRCPLDDHCSNKRFLKKEYSKVEAFKTLKKGWGLRAKQSIQPGQFIMEYVGEVIGPQEFNIRVKRYSKEERVHHFFMALKADEIIDATYKGNITRFVNHSCDPNAETQKWTVNGDLRIGFFSTKFIQAGEEITFDYQFQRYGKKAQKCFCESLNCRGYIGGTNASKQVEIDDVVESDDDTESVKKDKSINKIKEQFEDLALEEEIAKLKASGCLRSKNQTMMLARLMVRAEDTQNRFKLLEIIRNTQEPACLRLLLDYHCLQLIWSWMVDPSLNDIDLKAEIIKVLEFLPIPNKTVLKDSKVLDVVEKWSKQKDTLIVKEVEKEKKEINGEQLTNGVIEMGEDKKIEESDDKKDDKLKKTIETDKIKNDNLTTPTTETSSSVSSSLFKNYNIIKKDSKANQDQQKLKPNISAMAAKLLNSWKDLKEVYRIPRLERQKRHEDEQEADRKALENDSKLINNALIPSLRKSSKRPFDNGNRTSINYNTYKQNYQYQNYNYSQNDSSTSSAANKVSKEEHRAFFNIELMRKEYDEAMKQYKKQVQQYTEAINKQISMNTGLNAGLSIAQLQPPMPPAPPNVDLNNLSAAATINSSNGLINNNVNNFINHQMPSTPSTPLTNTFNYNISNKLYSNEEFNSNNQQNHHINQVNSNLSTPIYSNLKDVNIQSQNYYSQDAEYFSSLNKSSFTHQPHTPSQQELVTYNHLVQTSPQQYSNQQQQENQQMDYTQQSIEQNESHLNEKSWNTLFTELTAGLKSNLIELTNKNHILNEQKECNQPDHKIKYNEVEELSEKEIKQLDDLFLIPGTYFVSDNKTYFMPCNFISKKGYHKDELLIESNGDFDIPTKELSTNNNLSKNWSYLKDKNGYYYYSNESTNQIQWNVPLETADKFKSINNQNIKDIDIATLNEIIKLSNGLQNEHDPRKRFKSDNCSDLDIQEQLNNNNLSMELENKIVRFPNQQPAIKHYSERRMKEKFKSCLSEHIKNVLNPYRKHDCKIGRILCNDDFKYLARKLTHMIMLKELKHCKSAESLVVSDTVKHKSKEFVKKYMQKFKPFYIRPDDEEDDKEEDRLINSPISHSQQQNSNYYSAQNSETNSINTTPTSNTINNDIDLINNLDNLTNTINILNNSIENIASYESTSNTKASSENINLSTIESVNSPKNLAVNQESINVDNNLTEMNTETELTETSNLTDKTDQLID